jgi:hypothetical protein
MKLLVVYADQTPTRIQVRLDRVRLAVLREKISQRLFAETFEVLAQVRERAFRADGQPAAGRSTGDLPGTEVQFI